MANSEKSQKMCSVFSSRPVEIPHSIEAPDELLTEEGRVDGEGVY